jgi:nicotinic acid mononucleotide adenylyltransferase
MPSTLARQLADLDRAAAHVVARFGDGPPFAGRIAVLPSAFNPPTLAHLQLLETGREAPGVAGVGALLSTRNVDKGLHGATLAQRVEMLLSLARPGRLAVLATNAARLADQGGALRETFAGVEFDFIVGYDTLVRLFDASYYTDMQAELERFFANHRVIATNRAEHGVDEVERFLGADATATRFADRVLVREIDDHPASLSSTAARNDAAAGVDHPHLPRPVADYIRRHGLYRQPGADSPAARAGP